MRIGLYRAWKVIAVDLIGIRCVYGNGLWWMREMKLWSKLVSYRRAVRYEEIK